MYGIYEKYLARNLPEKERLYHLTTTLMILGFATCLYVAIFYEMPWYMSALIGCGLFISLGLFFKKITDEKHLNLCILIIYLCVLIIFPAFYLLSRGEALEAPLYYVCGLVVTAYLLDDKVRMKLIVIQMFVYLGSMFLSYLLFRESISLSLAELQTEYYVRFFIAIMINGSFTSLIAYSRSQLNHDQMLQSMEAMEKAREYGYSKDVFLVNISHDIRTPLNAIIGTCELIRDKEMTEETQENVEQILNFSTALLSITNNLLDFSKMDYEHLKLEEKVYDTTEMLNEIINMFAVQLLDTGVHFYPLIEADIPKALYGDMQRIYQIMTNLISYAVKNTEEGDLYFRVKFIRVDANNGRLSFSVKDESMGRNTEELKYILDEAFSFEFLNEDGTENMLPEQYVGILNSKHVAKAMGGFLKLETEEGSGDILTVVVPQKIENDTPVAVIHTEEENFLVLSYDEMEEKQFQFIFRQLKVHYTFVHDRAEFLEQIGKPEISRGFLPQVDLVHMIRELQNEFIWFKIVIVGERNRLMNVDRKVPCIVKPFHVMSVVDALTGQKNMEMKRRNRYSAYRCPNAKILIVDDNRINLEVAGGVLERIGANVTCVLSGKECLKKLETEDYDIILMDYMMPEMDGIDTLKNIKKMEREAVHDIPVIALTANAVSGSREMFLEAGFDDYCSKPIEMKSFYVMIRKYLDSSQLEFY